MITFFASHASLEYLRGFSLSLSGRSAEDKVILQEEKNKIRLQVGILRETTRFLCQTSTARLFNVLASAGSDYASSQLIGQPEVPRVRKFTVAMRCSLPLHLELLTVVIHTNRKVSFTITHFRRADRKTDTYYNLGSKIYKCPCQRARYFSIVRE